MFDSSCERVLSNAHLNRFLRTLVVLAVCVSMDGIMANNVRAESDVEPVIKKYSAVARKSMDFKAGNVVQKLDFRFDGATAWVREKPRK